MRLSTGLLALVASTPALVYAEKAQKADLVLPADAKESADKVRDIFLNSYSAYKCVLIMYFTVSLQCSHATTGSTHGVTTT